MADTEGRIKVVCPNCSTKQYVDAGRAFTKTFCENCSVRFTIPKLFGNLLLHDIISNDEFSTTYNSTNLEKGHPCHVRIFDETVYKNEEILRALKNQIYKIKDIDSSFICKVHSYGYVGEEFYLETQSDDSGSLKNRMNSKKVSQRGALQYAISLLECLEALGQHEVVLANLKPSTLRCLPDRKTRLDDLGITYAVASLLAKKQKDVELINNFQYAAPETIEKSEITLETDLYAAGCVIYELICKIPPFEEFDTRDKVLKAHVDEDPLEVRVRTPAIPEDVSKMVMKMISKNPDDRPDDLKTVIDCFAVNLKHVEEIKVDEIKREFDAPSPDQTLRTRPPTEIDLDLLSGDALKKSSPHLETQIDVEDLKESAEQFIDPDLKDIEPDIKLQDTAVDMQDFEDLEATYNAQQNFKMMMIGILIFVLIVGGGLLFVFSGGGNSEREPLPIENSQNETPSEGPQLKPRE